MTKKPLAGPACIALLALSAACLDCRAADKGGQPIQLAGRIIDGAAKPVSGARCFWDWSTASRERFVEAVSAADGEYELTEPPDSTHSSDWRGNGTLWILADGYAVRWLTYDVIPPSTTHRRRLDISLKPVRPIVYQVNDPDGHPRLGELIEPIFLISSSMMMPPPRPIRELLSGTTDEAGQLQMNWLAADQGMLVRVVSERFGIIQQQPHPTQEQPPVGPLRFPRTGSVEGSIQTDRPDLFSGTRVKLWSSITGPNPSRIHGVAEIEIDRQGRFSVPAIGEGLMSVELVLPDQAEFRPGRLEAVQVIAGQQTSVVIPVIRTIPLSGQVTRADGGPPGGGGTVTLSYADRNPEVTFPFDAEGKFAGRTCAGDVRLRADLATSDGLTVARGTVVGQTTMRIDAQSADVVSPVIKLPETRTIAGVALAQDGRPLVAALLFASFGKSSGAQVITDECGRFEFVVSEATSVSSYMYRKGERTLMSFDRSNDPLVLRLR